MIGLIPPTVTVMRGGVIAPMEAAWWTQEVTVVAVSALMTGVFWGVDAGHGGGRWRCITRAS